MLINDYLTKLNYEYEEAPPHSNSATLGAF